jgi:hypothetical protein
MWSDWLLNREEFKVDVVFLNETRVLFLTDFAIKFLEVVLNGTAHNFLFHFRLVPLLQTPKVNESASPAAFTRRAEELPQLCALAEHTVFALDRLPFSDRQRPNHYLLGVHPKFGLHLILGIGAIIDAGDEVLDPTELDNLSRTLIGDYLLSLYPLFSLFLFLSDLTMR